MKKKIAVIGGGAAGMSAALNAAERGCEVHLFEKNENIEVVIRPEDIKMVEPNEGMLKGIVTSTVFKGVHYEILVKENDRVWMLHNTKSAEVGSELGMDIYPEDIHIMRKEEN